MSGLTSVDLKLNDASVDTANKPWAPIIPHMRLALCSDRLSNLNEMAQPCCFKCQQ